MCVGVRVCVRVCVCVHIERVCVWGGGAHARVIYLHGH